ncbi:hypothetical protein JMA_27260 [Jeotgalibacillus malaysiensis]|uniref:Uncharacterized protein n=1 Tax=Jeotgalibacillus malaysiensis TaxID=1508404 RepID=A0A0B5ATZ1_9BACL|nr:hypothetical protein [Jeotgalibacillus malaysiensis]AJD92043.1 hypothetical protein JMA_27260 [Jeotgalibacillus malaysiensis]
MNDQITNLSVQEIIDHIEQKMIQNKAMIEINAERNIDSHKEEIITEALEELLNELQEN